MPTNSLSEKEKKAVIDETSLLCLVSSTHQFTGTVIATPKLQCKLSTERQATGRIAEVLSEMMERPMKK